MSKLKKFFQWLKLATTMLGALLCVGVFALLVEHKAHSVETRLEGICYMLFGLFLMIFPSVFEKVLKWSEFE
jgi:hypothetical protein